MEQFLQELEQVVGEGVSTAFVVGDLKSNVNNIDNTIRMTGVVMVGGMPHNFSIFIKV